MSTAWMSGSTRRVIEDIVDRIAAGEPEEKVIADYPEFHDEYGFFPDLKPIVRLRRALGALVGSLYNPDGELWEDFTEEQWDAFSKALGRAHRVLGKIG